jgi:hypothetical protein
MQTSEAILLEADLIIVVEVVDPHDLVPASHEPLGERRADETCRTGDKDAHVLLRRMVGHEGPLFAARPASEEPASPSRIGH